MNYKIKKFLKNSVFRSIIIYLSNKFQYYSFRGNYKSFELLQKKITKYDSAKIINKVNSAYKNSKQNTYLVDRDGETSYKKDQNFQLITLITRYLKKEKFGCVIDYGGSLANFYRNNLNYFGSINLIWIIIDNENICNLGRKVIKKNNIFFFKNLDQTKKFLIQNNFKVNFFLFGSSIQYIQNFETILRKMNSFDSKLVIVDRQPILKTKDTKICIQKTPFWSGNFSFVVKLYNSRSFVNLFNKYGYFLDKKINSFGNQFKDGEYKSFIFKKR